MFLVQFLNQGLVLYIYFSKRLTSFDRISQTKITYVILKKHVRTKKDYVCMKVVFFLLRDGDLFISKIMTEVQERFSKPQV